VPIAFVRRSPAAYVVGFRLAAESLVDLARQDPGKSDLLLVPAAYLYRHYLELMLKDLVRLGTRLRLATVAEKQLIHHDLDKLWHLARKVIEAFWPAPPVDDLEAVEHAIVEFHRLDPSGQAFRYPSDTNGNASLSGVPPVIDLDCLRATMEAVANFLEAAEAGIDAADPGST
jgi:hypothetical protein